MEDLVWDDGFSIHSESTASREEVLQQGVNSLLTILRNAGLDNPKILGLVDEDGRNPLGIASQCSSSEDLIQELAEIYPDAINTADEYDRSPIGEACQRDDLPWEALKGMIHMCPSSAITFPDSEHKTTVLHELCDNNAHLWALRLVIDRFSDALQSKESIYGDTPLHTACRFGEVSTEVVELLIESCPEMLTETNQDGETPLFLACDNTETLTEIVELLLGRGPGAISMKNNEGIYPLHRIAENPNLNLLMQMHHGYPDGIRQLTNHTHTPLHGCCCALNPLPVQNLGYLFELWPLACLIADNDGDTPYDCLLVERSRDIIAHEYMENVTKDVACAFIECITHSAAPPDAVAHVQEALIVALPADLHESVTNRRSHFRAESIRPHLGHETLQALLRNENVQQLLKNDEHLQSLIWGVMRMNQAGRSYFEQDPWDKANGVRVLHSSLGNTDCLYMHLKENPYLCS
jgi:ankyrin repeat protein